MNTNEPAPTDPEQTDAWIGNAATFATAQERLEAALNAGANITALLAAQRDRHHCA